MSTPTSTGVAGPRRAPGEHGHRGERDPWEWGPLRMGPDEVAAAVATRHATERLARRATARDLEAPEQDIVRAALAVVPAATHAGLTVLTSDRRLVSAAPSGLAVARLDQAQAALHEGPCFGAESAVDSSGVALVCVPDMALEAEPGGRWPRFGPEALRNGIRSAVSVLVASGDGESTALSLYATRCGAFGASAESGAKMFAGQAAAVRRASVHSTRQDLALHDRDILGQATGVLMQRHGIRAGAARAVLVGAAEAAGIELPDVARWLVGDLATRATDPA